MDMGADGKWDHCNGKKKGETGQAIVEYALLLAFVAAVSIGTMTSLGVRLDSAFRIIAGRLP
jgi:Flp pilus assembly pilin Flp